MSRQIRIGKEESGSGSSLGSRESDPARGRRLPPRRAPPPPYRFLHVSYAQPVKGIRTLIDVFRKVTESTDATLIIAGHNHRERDTETLIELHGLRDRVKLVGAIPNEEIAVLLDQAHFLLQTSHFESHGC